LTQISPANPLLALGRVGAAVSAGSCIDINIEIDIDCILPELALGGIAPVRAAASLLSLSPLYVYMFYVYKIVDVSILACHGRSQ